MTRELMLHKLVEAQAGRTPEACAISMGAQSLSYAELAARGLRIARGLAALGLRPGDRIAYLGKNDPRIYELMMAASAGGFVLVPLNWRLAPAELDVILNASTARVLLVESDFAAVGTRPGVIMALDDAIAGVDSYDAWAATCDSPDTGTANDPDCVVVQLYTSGTTGLPKGVMLTHRNFMGLRDPALGLPDWLIPAPGEVSLVAMPMFHVAGIAATLDLLCTGSGGTVILQREFDLAKYTELLATDAVTRLCLVPAMIRAIIDHIPLEACRSSRLRYVLYGASPMTDALLKDALSTFDAGLVQVYGLTETAGFVTGMSPEEHKSGNALITGSIGKPIAGVEVKVVSPSGTDLPDGETGEIWIRSVANMAGYFGCPEDTAKVLTRDGWLKTGDAGFIAPSGHIVLQDRIKNMIISGGENIYPAEVESAMSTCPGVADVAVVGIPDDRWGEVPRAFIVRRDAGLGEDMILEWTRGRLARYKVPKSVVFVDALPRNPSGKILHRVLRDQVGAAS